MADTDGYTVLSHEDFEQMEGSGETNWALARKSLGIGAFGMNLVEIGPGGQIPEHTEGASGQIEVFTILEGDGTFRLNGEDHDAPAGTFVRIDPDTSRTIVNNSDGNVKALLIGVPADSGYSPQADWL